MNGRCQWLVFRLRGTWNGFAKKTAFILPIGATVIRVYAPETTKMGPLEMKTNTNITEEEASNWCKTKLAGFKVPKKFIFEVIPKTSTGKVQKYILRKRAESLSLSKSV